MANEIAFASATEEIQFSVRCIIFCCFPTLSTNVNIYGVWWWWSMVNGKQIVVAVVFFFASALICSCCGLASDVLMLRFMLFSLSILIWLIAVYISLKKQNRRCEKFTDWNEFTQLWKMLKKLITTINSFFFFMEKKNNCKNLLLMTFF